MKVHWIQDGTLDAMEQYMTRLSKRQQIVASNIANIDTPGYRTREISFHATMEEIAAAESAPLHGSRPRAGHIPIQSAGLGPEVYEVEDLPMRPDRNNVDIDREMRKLGQTAFGYSVMAQLVRVKFRILATSINEGRAG